MPKSDTQFKAGQSGNPSGRPKAVTGQPSPLYRAHAAELSPRAVRLHKAIEQMLAPLLEMTFVRVFAGLKLEEDALARWEDDGGRGTPRCRR